MNDLTSNYRLICLQDIEAEDVKWMMYPLFPYGKVSILAGQPAAGKTTFVLNLVAQLSKGEPLFFAEDPEKNDDCGAVVTIYQSAEDGLADTIKPRLIKAGADCNNVVVIDESLEGLSFDDERLMMAIKETGAKVVVLDPMQAYIGGGTDFHRANQVREKMTCLTKLAEDNGCAVILIAHFNKDNSKAPIDRIMGSRDITAAVRSVVSCGRAYGDDTLCILWHEKSSLAPNGAPIAYRIDPNEGFSWVGEVDIKHKDIDYSGENRGKNKTQEAREFIELILDDVKEIFSVEILKMAEARGIKERTLNEAKRQLGIKSKRVNDQWVWYR